MSRLLASWLFDGARRWPTQCALLTPRRAWSYRELAAFAAHRAALLRSAARDPTTGALVCAADADELALAVVACAAAGVALLPLDPRTATQVFPRLQALAGGRLRWLPTLPPTALANAPPSAVGSPEEVACLIATSGSEGDAKVVMLTDANLEAAVAAANARLSLRAGDRWLACLPLHHIAGLSIVYRCLRAGATAMVHDGFSAGAVWLALQSHPVSHLSLVPVMLARLLEVAASARPPATLRHVLVGGAALSRPLFERALAAGWPICPTWGMSESAAQAATRVNAGSDWQVGQVGLLLGGLEARVAADGRIHLRGPQLMAGYLNREWLPGQGLVDGWLETGDLGSLNAAGELTILGRADDLMNSGGVKVHPLVVESCLAGCPGVRDAAVSALPDAEWGDTLVALIVGDAETPAVIAWIGSRLSPAQRPRRVIRVATLPRNTLGKLERPRLRQLVQETLGINP